MSCPIILLATISIQDHVRDGAEPEFNNIAELLCSSSSSTEQLNSLPCFPGTTYQNLSWNAMMMDE